MRKHHCGLLSFIAALLSSCIASAAPFSQDFNGNSLNAGWTFESPNAASSMSFTGTALNIMAAWQNGGSDLFNTSNFQAPRLLQPVDPTLDWTIETAMNYAPGNNFSGAGLLLANTSGIITNLVEFNRIGQRYSNPGQGLQVVTGVAIGYSGTTTYMRVQKAGINYTGFWSTNGVDWTETGMITQTNQWTYFGLFDIRQPYDSAQVDSSANFLYFHVTTNQLQTNTFTWTGAISTDWTNANNWYPIGVPGKTATVIINSGTPTINAATNVGSLTLNGGTLNAGPGLVVTNVCNWTGGTLAGLLTIPSGATLNLANPGGQLNMPNGSIVNNGTAHWTGGTIRGSGATVVTNNGSWLAQTDDAFNDDFGGGQSAFFNAGTFTKSPTTGTAEFGNAIFNNSGSVNVQSGTLNLNGGGFLNGPFIAGAGANVLLTGGSFSYGPAVGFTGSGSSSFTGGTITLTNNPIPNLPLSGGTVILSPTFQNGTITNLTLTGGTLSGDYTVAGTLNWVAGGVSGGLFITSAGTLNVSGSSQINQSADITNAGHIVWNGSANWRLQALNGAAGSIRNLPGGIFDILCSEQMETYYGSEFIVNQGLMRKMQDSGVTTIDEIFTNTGTISVLSGTLNFSAGNFGGSISAANGTTINFQNGGILSGVFTTGFDSLINLTSGVFTPLPGVAFTGPGVAEQTGGTLTLLNDVIPNLQLNGGTLNLPPGFQNGVITNLTLNNETLTGSNAVTGTLTINNSTVSGPLYVAVGATVNWTSGQLAGPLTVANGGTVNLLAPGGHAMGAAVTNGGTFNWTGGEARIEFANGFYNLASGAFNIDCDQSLDSYYGPEFFNNYGVIAKSGTLGNTAWNVILNNFGSVNISSGEISFNNNDLNQILGGNFSVAAGAELNFGGGGYLTGTYSASVGGQVLLSGGTFTNTPTTLFAGAGSFSMTGGTITLISNLIPNLQLNGGTVGLSPAFQGGVITNLTLNGTLAGSNYVNGTLNLTGNTTGPLTISSNSVFNFNGTVSAPLNLMPTATLNWAAGTINTPFTIPSNAVVNLAAPGGHGFGGPTTNAGTVNWLAGEMRILYGDGFYNLSGAAFNIQCDQSVDSYYGSEFFNNYGQFVKSVTTGNTAFNPTINNFGNIVIQTGQCTFNNNNQAQTLGGAFSVSNNASLNFAGGGLLTGTYNAAAGGLINLSGGTFTNTLATVFQGAGTITMNGGTITLISNLIPNLQINGGTAIPSAYFQNGQITNLTLNANLGGSNYVNGVLTLNGNTTGPLVLSSNSVLNLNGTISGPLVMMPTATINMSGGQIGTSLFVPSNAVVNLLGPGGQGFGGPTTNAGTINWLGGETRIFYGNTVYNSTNATFNIQCDLSMDSYYGTEVFNNAGLVKKFSTSGRTTFNPSVQNTGTLDAESGQIFLNNGTVSPNAGVWLLGINGAGSNGQIGYPNSVPLAGTLAVKVNNYTLGLSNQFSLVTYGSQSGAFAATNLPGLGASWQLAYGANAVTLQVTNLNTPTVTLLTPSSNQVYILPTSVAFSASVTDPFAAITSVQYFQGANLLGQATVSPYNFSWNSATSGYYTVSAVATDAHGATAASAPVNISVFGNIHHATNYTWTGAVSTDWSTAGNWTPANVPSILDTVNITSGTVNLATADAVSIVNISGGTLQGPGILTVTNSVNWSGGNLNGALTIGTNATFTTGSGGQLSGLTLNNYGTAMWFGGNLNGNAQTIITNYGLWLCQSDNQITFNSGAPFVNKGTLRKTAYTGATTLTGMSFTNVGVVDAERGNISFQSGGTLTGTYNATNGAAINFNGGMFTLDQTPIFTGGGSFNFQNGSLTLTHDAPAPLNLVGGNVTLGAAFQNAGAITNLTLSGSTLTGTNTISGTMDWAAGGLNGQLTVAHNGVLNITTGNTKNLSVSALINSGQVNWIQGSINGDSSSVITNNSLWLAQTDDQFGFNNGAATFVNNGTFRKTAFNGITYFRGILVLNNGTMDAESGSINFQAGGVLSGTYNAAAGANINFASGNFTLGAQPAITGTGSVNFSGGGMSVLTNLPTNLQLTGGTLTLAATFQKNGVITNLTLVGSTLSGNYTVTGTMNFYGGSVNGSLTIASNATLNLPSGTHDFSSCLFTNLGTVFWTGGSINGNSSTLFVNNGLWEALSNDSFNSGATFVNNSTYRKLGATGESDFNSEAFNNLGLVDVQTGTVAFQNGGTLGGTYNTSQFGAVILANGAYTSPFSPVFSGLGVYQFQRGTLTLVNDQITNLNLTGGNVILATTFQNHGAITNLTINGSTLTGSNLVTGTLNWLAGGLNGSQLYVASNGTVNLLSLADKNLPNSLLVNNGTIIWGAGRMRGGTGTVVTNNNLWLVQCDNVFNTDFGGTPSIVNNGVLEKTGTFGATTFSAETVQNSGTINIQSGSINLNGGSTYAQNGETLIFGVSAPNVSGELNLPGPVNFDGKLQVQFLNGYTPTLQDQLVLLTYASEAGAFASLDLPSLPVGETWNLAYGASSTILNILPPPATNGAFQISGTVKDNQGNPLTGVRVYATPQGNSFTNLVQNGSFEVQSAGNLPYIIYGIGATNVAGWTIVGPTNANIALTSVNWNGPAEDGVQFMDPSGNTGGAGVSQTFATVPGKSYELIFYHGTESQRGFSQAVGVTIGTNSYAYGETSGGGGNFDWRRVEIPFTANSNLTTLSFNELTGQNSDDGFVDNVQVVTSDYFNSVLEAVTDATGHYQISAPNATYSVDASGLGTVGYQDVAAQTVAVNNANATANFVTQPLAGVQLFTITTAVNPPVAGVATGGGSFISGSGITVTTSVTNQLPYTFVNWTQNGVQQSVSPSYSFTVLRSEQLVANFILPVESITATVSPGNAGTVQGGGNFSYGTTNDLTASAAFGFQFNHWSDQSGNALGSSPTLAVVALSNGVYVANYTGTNLEHFVTTGTLPANLATVAGGGLYANGQTAAISAPAFVTNGLTYYAFSQFLLNGNAFTNVNAFNWTFNTTIQSNLPLTAVYGPHSVRPLVFAAQGNIANPVKATTGFILTIQFDRAMQASTLPLVLLTNSSATLQPTVPANGLWSTNVFANDTYTTPAITFAHGMDGTNLVFVSQAIDLHGDAVVLTNVLSVVVDATPPVISGVNVTPGTISATVNWNTDEPATSDVNYGPTSTYNASSGANSQLVTSHSVTLNGLAALSSFHYQIVSHDQAGNQTVTADAVFSTIAAPDLQVAKLAVSPALTSGGAATISWVDTNTGSGATFASWYDHITASNTTAHQTILDTTSYYDSSANGNIAGGGGHNRSYAWNLPNGSNGAGNIFITVTANTYSNQFEVTTANNAQSISASSTLSLYPDLQVVNVSATPAIVTSGTTVTLNWVDTNTGTGPVSASFSDQVVVTNLTTSAILYNNSISYDETASGAIAAGGSAHRQATFIVPNGTAGVGTLGIGILADSGNNIFEYNSSGTAESNNTNTLKIISTLSSYPDLVVTNVTTPATASAGQTVLMSWVDTNKGNAAATNSWTEEVFLSSDGTTNSSQLIGTFTYAGGLAPGHAVTNTNSVQLPAFVSGNKWVVVHINPSTQVFVLDRSGAVTVSAQPTLINSTLALSVNPTSFAKNAVNPAATGTVTRQGATAGALTVSLSSDNSGAATVPASVVIPSGQSSVTFPISAVNSAMVQGTRTADIIASATGFANVTNTVTVTDSSVPTLTLSIGANTVGVSTNPAIACSVSRNTATTAALTVAIVTDPTQLSAPTTVTIPAGAASAPFAIHTVDLHIPRATYQASVNPSATGYASQAGSITIVDDDAPVVKLSFADSIVSKGAVNPATQGQLTVSTATTQAVTVLLATISPAISIPASAVIPANLTNVSFPVNVVQDNLVTGDRVAVVTAQLSDAISPIPLPNTATTASITVTDNNGPALSVSLANSTIAENGSTTATVTRNTPATNALTVSVSSSLTSAASVPASVIIPNDSASKTFTVTGVNPGVPTGPRKADITASASGFGSGVASLTVSDINIPDLVVTSITAPGAGLTTSNITVSYVIANNGLGATTNTWRDAVYYSTSPDGENPQLLTDVFESSALGVGQSHTNNVTVRLPNAPGSIYFVVTANVDSAVLEANYQNNTLITATPTTNSPTYHAFIQADLTEGISPDPVPMNGYAYNSQSPSQHVPNVPVNIGVLVKGTLRNFTVTTDANGNFTNLFQPIPGEAGHYGLTADYPSVAATTVQSSFDLFGVRISDSQENVKLYPGTPITNQTTVVNLSDLPLTGVEATAVGFPAEVNVQLNLTNGLSADGNATLTYTLNVSNLTSALNVQAYIEVTTDQGAVAYLPFNLSLAPQTALLVCNPVSLQASMLIGQQTLVDFDIQNVGGAASGPVTLELPTSAPWLTAASSTNIPSLAPGQSNRFIIALNPALNLPLQQYSGSMVVAIASGGVNIPFTFRAISDAVGSLQVAVQDEYTFFVAGSPQVTNAQVILTDPITGSVVASNVTDQTGNVLFSNIDQGSYQMTVSAVKHSTYQSPVTIQPGTISQATAFISRQTVSYSWTVVPSTVQDQYQVTLQPQFETEVPIPVITVDNPFQIPLIIQGRTSEVDYKVSNHGLIAAQQISLNLPTDDPNFIYTPLSDSIDEIPANTAITLPVLISWKTNSNNPNFVQKSYARQRANAIHKTDAACAMLPQISVNWSYVCGPDRHWHITPTSLVNYPISEACADISAACINAQPGAANGVAVNVTACAVFGCIQSCATPNACLNAIVGAVCGSGDVQAAVNAALNSGNCTCPTTPPLPNLNQNPNLNLNQPPPLTQNPPPANTFGGPNDPYPDPINWDLQGCTPGQNGGPAGSPGPQYLSVRKTDGPTTAAGDVCAHVTIQLDQKIALTRNAFKGSLVIDDSDSNDLTSVLVALNIVDDNGDSANDLFGIQPPTLTGVSAVDGSGVIAGDSSGTVQYTFVPTHGAAPTLPVHYRVGGTLSYMQSGNAVTVTLAPQDIYVYPDPVLSLDYFLQRDVIGDDPVEPGTVTPQPFDLGLMVRNSGYGSALDFTVTSAQPHISENTKGLLINFQLIGTEVGTNILTPSLTADLGTLAPQSTTVAVWQLMCSLAGRFTSYSASFQQLSQLGSAQTSLIDSVNIHQMIHAFMAVRQGDDEVPDFLVNDIPNANNLPDTVYLSDGSTNSVAIISGAQTDAPIGPGHMQAVLTATMSNGWNYLEAADPGPGYILYRATRSDGLDMKVPYNIWTTPLSFPASQTGALHTNLVHLVDFDGTGSYTLYYHNTNTVAPAVMALQSITPFIQSGPVSSVQITFSEPIDLSTFSVSALTLTQNGGPNLINSGVTVTLVSNATYSINGLAGLTGNQGNYQLTVNTANVQDFGGNSVTGNAVVSTSWAEGNPPMIVQNITPVTPNPRNTPVNSVTVTLDKAANASTFNFNAISLTLNGGPNLSGSGITVAQVNSTTFQINGLAALTGTAGTYALTVNAAALQDSGGNPGVGSLSTSWSLITTGPTIASMPAPQSPRNIAVSSQVVNFSEAINPATFNSDNLTLTLNGGANLITSGVTITQLSPTSYQIQNLAAAAANDGKYTLTVNATSVSDLAGNGGTGSSSVTWTVNTHPPAAPAHLAISPITGVYSNLTSSNAVTLSGTVVSNGLTVWVIDQTTSQDWGTATLVGTNFTDPLTLSQGSHTLQVYTVDSAANISSNSFFTAIVDQTPISATFDAITPSTRLTPVTNVNITFDKPMDITTVHASSIVLTLNGTNIFHPSLTMVSSNVYQVGGLSTLTSAQGSYALTVNFSGMRDDAGNAGSGAVSTSWQEVASLLPVISQVGNVSLQPGKKLKLTLSPSDPSSFPLVLALGADAPEGLLLDSNTITWTPTCAQGSSSNVITIWAVEAVTPYLSNSMSFSVIVGDCAEIQVGSTIVLAGSSGAVPLNVLATGNVTNLSFVLNFPTNRLVNWTIAPSNSSVGALAVQGLNANQSVFTLGARNGQSLLGSAVVGSLSFNATAGSSAFISLAPTNVAGTENNGVGVGTTFSEGGRIVLVGPQPLLEAAASIQPRNIILYGIPGNSYQIQSSGNLDSSANWTNFLRVPMTNLMFVLSNLNTPSNSIFYRAYSFQASPPILDSAVSGLLAFGVKGTNYEIQFSTNISTSGPWNSYLGYTLSNSFQFITNVQHSNPATFFRIKTQ